MESTSNRLTGVYGGNLRGFWYDSVGNFTQDSRSDSSRDYLYDLFNRMKQVKKDGVVVGTYVSNALNQRAIKTTSAGTSHFIYGP